MRHDYGKFNSQQIKEIQSIQREIVDYAKKTKNASTSGILTADSRPKRNINRYKTSNECML